MNLTNYAENKIADFMRGQGLTLPADWYFALGSVADDGTFTEVAGASYGRVAVTRNLTNFSGTQGPLTTAASNGTSHETRNNNAITWPTAGSGGWSPASYVGVFDNTSGGNCWFYGEMGTPVTVSAGSAYPLAISAAVFQLGLTGGMSDYLANVMIDLLFRGQAYTWPATTYVRLVTTTPSNGSGGVEVIGGGYARQPIASTLAAWSGTQAAGSTSASSGTSGRISNNGVITFPAVTANWGTITHQERMDALSGGNRLFWGSLASPKTISSGALPPRFDANTLGITAA